MITRSRASYGRPFRIASLTLSVLLLLALCYFGAPTLGFDFVGIYAVALIAASPAIALMGRKGIAAAYLFLASAPFLQANAYCKMLGAETPANFHDVLPPIDIEQARSCREAWRCRPCKNADKCYGLDPVVVGYDLSRQAGLSLMLIVVWRCAGIFRPARIGRVNCELRWERAGFLWLRPLNCPQAAFKLCCLSI